jgi:hypothetical protein
MIEIIQHMTSGFWVFVGCYIIMVSAIAMFGWAMNAIIFALGGGKID